MLLFANQHRPISGAYILAATPTDFEAVHESEQGRLLLFV